MTARGGGAPARAAAPLAPASALAVGAALLLAGCPARPCPTRPFTDPAALLASYRDMRRPARVLRAEARVDQRGERGRVRGTVLMFLERPDKVRFDIMTQVGPAAVLTSDGETFALMDLRENRFLTGPTCPANIERLLGLRFGAEQVTRFLLGQSPRIEHEDAEMYCEGGAYRVILRAADGRRQELVYEVREADLPQAPPEEQRLRLKRSEVFEPDGSTAWRVTYDDYQFVADPLDDATPPRGLVLPFTVRFEDPRRGQDTMVRFQDVDLNVEVPPGAFEQRPRPGLTVEHVGCDRG
jgi:outer membrane lipoprotein-sorting protein